MTHPVRCIVCNSYSPTPGCACDGPATERLTQDLLPLLGFDHVDSKDYQMILRIAQMIVAQGHKENEKLVEIMPEINAALSKVSMGAGTMLLLSLAAQALAHMPTLKVCDEKAREAGVLASAFLIHQTVHKIKKDRRDDH